MKTTAVVCKNDCGRFRKPLRSFLRWFGQKGILHQHAGTAHAVLCHDLLFIARRFIFQFNKGSGRQAGISFVMLSTLDENRDAKLVATSSSSVPKEKGTNQREQSTDEEH